MTTHIITTATEMYAPIDTQSKLSNCLSINFNTLLLNRKRIVSHILHLIMKICYNLNKTKNNQHSI